MVQEGDNSPIMIRSESECKNRNETLGLEERSELYRKRVRLRDLETSTGINGRNNLCVANDNEQKRHDFARNELVGEVKMRGIGLDLNAEDVSSSANAIPFHSRDVFECASSVGPLEGRAPLRVWSESRNNASFAYSRGEMLLPKPHLRKGKNVRVNNKKIELAKKEQADRFAKVAAPTGLLNGLNPGIINHVRNGKQVYSIIEALVRPEKGQKFPAGEKHSDEQMKSGERNDLGSSYAERTDCINGKPQSGYGNSCMVEPRDFERTNYPSEKSSDFNNNIMCNDGSTNLSGVTALSIKAANVASKWLELLNQDTKCRLAALRSSRKRVREVIQTEFPRLISSELSCKPEDSAIAHRARWNAMFDQMDKTLSEEESQLVNWRKQICEMQLQCDRGLIKYNMPIGSSQFSALQNNRLEQDPGRDLAVRAAAASIYSTCNFLSSIQNLPCC